MARKWWTLLAACVATFMLLLDITVVNVALPPIQRDLKATFTDVQLDRHSFGLVLGGVGIGVVNPVVANVALSTVPEEHSGVASGINDTFRQVGIAAGTPGWALSFWRGRRAG